LKIAAEDVAGLHAGLRAGFRLVDIAVTLERRPEARTRRSSVAVRAASPDDGAVLRRWAGRSFAFSRFHLDPAVGSRSAEAVKTRWIEELLAGRRGDRLWTADDGARRAVGFLARRCVREKGRRVGVLDLMAVRPTSRGGGVGEALVRRFVHDGRVDCDLLRVGTQAANAPSLRLYQRCGFSIASTHYVLHAHRGVHEN
jgi:dTDP-4-amino-4,6-dideoxy-D-galactose acyltransferase